ncbi:MAG: hypothetical protein JSV42_12280 [Chloroflexota bacterium]|nr:MAG: hypothetical protein JSV42_12280 [Chloroflexota bacterium]
MDAQPAGMDAQLRRKIYLLTCWQEQDHPANSVSWRFSLETPGSNTRALFTNLKDLMISIESELSADR